MHRRELVKFLAENAVFDEGRDAVYLLDFVSDYPSWEAFCVVLVGIGGAGEGNNITDWCSQPVLNHHLYCIKCGWF